MALCYYQLCTCHANAMALGRISYALIMLTPWLCGTATHGPIMLTPCLYVSIAHGPIMLTPCLYAIITHVPIMLTPWLRDTSTHAHIMLTPCGLAPINYANTTFLWPITHAYHPVHLSY